MMGFAGLYKKNREYLPKQILTDDFIIECAESVQLGGIGLMTDNKKTEAIFFETEKQVTSKDVDEFMRATAKKHNTQSKIQRD